MSNTDDSKVFCDLTRKPKLRSDEERIAKIREREKRKRKEELYSYRTINH